MCVQFIKSNLLFVSLELLEECRRKGRGFSESSNKGKGS